MTIAGNQVGVKVCGLKEEKDVRLCLELGVDFTGFIFVKGSPRYVPPQAAALLPRGNALRVGIFAGHSVDEVKGIMCVAGLDLAQLHGDEDAVFCQAVGPERVIKVLWPERLAAGSAETPGLADLLHEQCETYRDACSMFLLDAGTKGGGSGAFLPWADLHAFTPPRPWLLAGGIGPHNAVSALKACCPDVLDCNSALESEPGRKDENKLRALLAAVGC